MILDFLSRYKIIIWIIIIILALATAGFIYYRVAVFQVTSTNPANGTNFSAGSITVTMNFNKDLQTNNPNQKVNASANIIKNTQIEGNKLIINLINLQINTNYQIELQNMTSTDNQVISSFVYKFKNNYVHYDQLSNDLKKQFQQSTDKGNTEDPALKATPHTTSTYSITTEILSQPNAKGKTINLTIALLVPNYEQNNTTKLKDYKTQALDYLKSKGVDPNNYVIKYFPTAATNL